MAVARLPELRDTLKTFVHILVQEELRDRFLGREAMKILRAKADIKSKVTDGATLGERIRNAILESSVLAQNITTILESYQNEQTKKLTINDWVQM